MVVVSLENFGSLCRVWINGIVEVGWCDGQLYGFVMRVVMENFGFDFCEGLVSMCSS